MKKTISDLRTFFDKRTLFKRALSLFLSFLLAVGAFQIGLTVLPKTTGAREVYFGKHTLDSSSGAATELWFDSSDSRYSAYSAGFTLGDESSPYIIKNADELRSLAIKVNSGNSFSGKFINITGLSQSEADALKASHENDYAASAVIDLRLYDGSQASAGAAMVWEPIGMNAASPFGGTVYSSTSVSIINLSYSYKSEVYNGTVYGLFGYNSGTIGGDKGGFKVSAMDIATTSASGKNLDFTSKKEALSIMGGVAALNNEGAEISNIDFGIGKSYNLDTATVEDTISGSSIILPKNDKSPLSVGAIAAVNLGAINNCSARGSITSAGENGGAGIAVGAQNGIGTIAGFSSGTISNCAALSDINISRAAPNVKIGGVAGYTGGAVSKSVFVGSLYAQYDQKADEKVTEYSYMGGIAGFADSTDVSQCASAADILFTYGGVPKIGGIAGVASNTAINECFATGSLTGSGNTGGIAGEINNSSAVKNSYYTGTLRGYGYSDKAKNLSVKSGFESVAGALISGTYYVGGIVGYNNAGSLSAVENSYFAGSTLSSDIGSVYGNCPTGGASTNVYYDGTLSPNRAVGAADVSAMSGSSKDTLYLISGSAALSGSYVQSRGAYARLAWAANADTSSDFGKLVKAISYISGVNTIDIGVSNAVAQNGVYNAYQMQSSPLNESLFNAVSDASAGVASDSGWGLSYAYTGTYGSDENLGGIFKNTLSVSAGIFSSSVTVSRKLLKAVGQTQGNACGISSTEDMRRFLDISNFASGAYLGGKFVLSADIGAFDATTTESVENKSGADKFHLDLGTNLNNFFCSELDGMGYALNGVNISGTNYSLFRIGMNAKIHNLEINNIVAGTADSPVSLPRNNSGFLFMKFAGTEISDISINSASVCGKTDKAVTVDKTAFSLFGTPAVSGNRVADISAFGINVSVKEIAYHLTYGLICPVADKMTVGTITVDDYTLLLGNYSETKDNNKNTLGWCGGLFATVAAGIKLKDSTITNFNAHIDAYNFPGSNMGFGGIAGALYGGGDNCSVSGKIIGVYGGTASFNTALTGGITAFGNNNQNVNGCTFEGEIDGLVSGGIVALTNYGASVTNCKVYASINSKPALRGDNAKSLKSGGIVGDVSAGNTKIQKCAFMGNVSGDYAGGIIGESRNSPILTDVYAKAIVNSTAAVGGAGGLVGSASGQTLTANNSYFAGQLNGAGSKGGIAGKAKVLAGANTFFDKNISGFSITAVASISSDNPDEGKRLDSLCAKPTSGITKALLGSSYVSESYENYPQLSIFASGTADQKAFSELSSEKVFAATNDESHLLGIPSFDLIESSGNYTVERNTATTDTLSPWDEVLNYQQGASAVPFGTYSQKAKGNTAFTVKNSNFLPGSTLDMVYNIIVKPFNYGDGTQDSPYIIYDKNELIKFRDYLEKGFDTVTQYYKIGSVVDNVIVGDPITIDLAWEDWKPIVNLAGHLDGNDSAIKNITCGTGYQKKNEADVVVATYYGFFGSTTVTGDVHDLSLDSVKINVSDNNVNVKAGSFIGISAGGTYSNITVTDSVINTGSLVSPNIGGFVGEVSLNSGVNMSIDKCMVYSEMGGTGNNGNAGGLVGQYSGSNSNLVINGCAAYGSVKAYTKLGGIVGSVLSGGANIATTVSTMDLDSTNASYANIGGIIGASSNNTEMFSLNDCIYGGKITHNNSVNNKLGGMVGYCRLYDDLSKKYTFPSEAEVSFINEHIYSDEAEIRSVVDTKLAQYIQGCYYNGNINPYPSASVSYAARFAFVTDEGNPFKDMVYENTLVHNFNARSSTYAMTSADGSLNISGGNWYEEKGYYPRPIWFAFAENNGATQRDELYVNDIGRFYSLGVYYTNAGNFGDNTYSNIFVTADDVAMALDASDYCVRTANEKMYQSIGEGAEIPLTFQNAGDGYKSGKVFSKTVGYKPSVISCGVSDYSFYFANPDGMWVTEKSITNGAGEETKTSYPWTLYTADQLQGLTELTSLLPDGNALTAGGKVYDVTPPSGTALGESFVMGADIDCGGVYSGGFRPICYDSAKPFDTAFNGMGHVISNLNINSSDGVSLLGLFGNANNSEISNVGIVSGQIVIDDTVTYAGGIIASMQSNSSVINCFNSVPIISKGDKASSVGAGGIAGVSSGSSNSIINCFNTGLIYSSLSGSKAGGIIALSGSCNIKNCYSAAYIQASVSGIIAAAGSGKTENCYYDIGACGDLPNTNGAQSAFPDSASLGSAFTAVDGAYPVQNAFADAMNDKIKAALIPVDMTNARSVTAGSLTYPGASLYYVPSYGGFNFPGTVGLNDVQYGESTPFTSFEKMNTGLSFIKVSYNGSERLVLANLQCWYDSGLESGVFTINTAKELAEFAAIVNGTLTDENNPNGRHDHGVIANKSFKGLTVTLGADINLSSFDNWTPVGTDDSPFEGTFDGNGKVISSLTVTSPNGDGNSALFGTVNDALITNLGVSDSAVTSDTGNAAAVAAVIKGMSTVEGCFAGVNVSGLNAGGVVADIGPQSLVSQCYNMGVISGTALAGGLAAKNGGTILNCYNTGIVGNTGVTAASAGITAENSGRAEQCYNASYVTGLSVAPVAFSGSISGCSYEPKLLSYEGTVAGVSKNVSVPPGLNIWGSDNGDCYPELTFFKDNSSVAFQDASELSVLKLDFNGGKYLEFISAKMPAVITSDNVTADVELSSAGNIFSVTRSGDNWNIEPASEGGNILTAAVNNSAGFTHEYYVIAVMSMKIRYKFDFTQLFGGSPNMNDNYHSSISGTSTWNESNGTTFDISTADDFVKFAQYASANDTTGKTFNMNYPIDMSGKTLSPIGSEKYPFSGTFDAHGYTVSNLAVTASGTSALFGAVGARGKVANLMLDNYRVTANKITSAMYASCIAGVNMGTLLNVGINSGALLVNNASSNQETYLGLFAARNDGAIKGCYFIQSAGTEFGITHYSASDAYVGGMVGDNRGSVTGCYYAANIFTNNIKAIAGANNGKTDNIINCYFNINGDAQPIKLAYAFDDVAYDNYWVKASDMKNKEFAAWLSSNLYAGTYEQGTVANFDGSADTSLINGGYPYLTSALLPKYDLSGYFTNSNSMMLSVWNLEDGGNSSFLNGVFALDALDFKYFNSIITHQRLRFDMTVLPFDIGYDISSRLYGVNAEYKTDVGGGALLESENVKDLPITSTNEAYEINIDNSGVSRPNLVVVTVALKKSDTALPWGVYREWSAT